MRKKDIKASFFEAVTPLTNWLLENVSTQERSVSMVITGFSKRHREKEELGSVDLLICSPKDNKRKRAHRDLP